MSKNNKLLIDMKLASLKLKSIFEEVSKLNDSLLVDVEDEEKKELILISQFELLYQTVNQIPEILDTSLSRELKEKVNR